MTTAQEIMPAGVQYIPITETLDRAAQLMREHDVGALPVCDVDGKLAGIVTDRDIVIKCVSRGHDPAMVTAGAIMVTDPRSVETRAAAAEVLAQMASAQIRRLPVLEAGQLASIISEADIVRMLPQQDVCAFAQALYG